MTRIWLAFAMLAAALSLAACSGPYSDLQRELRQNEQKWTSQKTRDYSYTLRIGCFCPPEITSPVLVEVRGGTTKSVSYVSDGREATNELFRKADTIEELFSVIRESIDQKVDKLTVEYDPSLGYPTEISIDPIETAIDEERAYTVSNFRRVE